VRELEKKFSGKHVILVAERTILPKEKRNNRQQQKRPYSRTIRAVHEGILEDLVFPVEIVGKRIRYRLDGTELIKVHLDPKEEQTVEHKIETFASIYKRLTGKRVEFVFPEYRL